MLNGKTHAHRRFPIRGIIFRVDKYSDQSGISVESLILSATSGPNRNKHCSYNPDDCHRQPWTYYIDRTNDNNVCAQWNNDMGLVSKICIRPSDLPHLYRNREIQGEMSFDSFWSHHMCSEPKSSDRVGRVPSTAQRFRTFALNITCVMPFEFEYCLYDHHVGLKANRPSMRRKTTVFP